MNTLPPFWTARGYALHWAGAIDALAVAPTPDAPRTVVEAQAGTVTTPASEVDAIARRRELARTRTQRWRDARRASQGASPRVTESVTASQNSVTARHRDAEGGRGVVSFGSDSPSGNEEKTQENKANTNTKTARKKAVTRGDAASVTVTLPVTLIGTEFEAAWNRWVEHCKDRPKAKPFTQRAAEQHLRWLTAPGVSIERACATIAEAIGRGWLAPKPEWLETTHRPGNFTPAQRLTPVEQTRAKRDADTDWGNG